MIQHLARGASRSLLWFVLGFMPFIVCAQTRYPLTGRITDAAHQPLPYATVAVEGETFGTYSDEAGNYVLTLPVGTYTIVYSSVGYETLRLKCSIRRASKQDVVLREDAITLHAVEVYGKSQTQQIREGVFAANALDVKPLANSVHNLNEMVNRSTGIRVREEGGVGSDFDLSINGMSGNSVRYFLDGVPLDAKGSGVSLANLPVNLIERIEIYKGVVPASLGADALGGAINIITNQAARNYLDASYGVGSFHTHKADLNAQFVEPKSGLQIRPTVGINYSKNDYLMKGVEVWDEASRKYIAANRKRFHDDYFSLLAQLEVGVVNNPWADAFYVSGSYSKTDKDLQTGSIQSKVYGEARRLVDAWNLSARYRKRDFLFQGLQLNASLSHTWDHSLTVDSAFRKYNWDGEYIETTRNEITGNDRSLRHYKRPLTIVRTNFDYLLAPHHSVNLNYLLNRTGNQRTDDLDTDFEPSKDVLTKHIIGLSYNQSLLEGRLENTLFVKDYLNHLKLQQQDQYWITGSDEMPASSTKNNVGYGLGSRFEWLPELAFKASFEHSVRLPLARELLGNGTTVYPNVRLQPENSNNVNAGLYGTLTLARQHRLYYEVNGFFRDVNDYIRAVLSQMEGMMQYENVASVDIKGVEGELRYTWSDRLQVVANASYQDARDKQQFKADGKPSISYNNKIPNRPWLFSNAEVNWTFPHVGWPDSKLQVGYRYQYVHWFYLTWEGYGSLESKSRIPTQHVHGVLATYSWHQDRYNLSLECTNLLDARLYDNFMLQKPGRSFFCKFRLFIH